MSLDACKDHRLRATLDSVLGGGVGADVHRPLAVQQELKRRTVKVRVFPGDDALLRLVSAVLVEIDEKWASDTKAYIKWECQDA